MTFTSKHGNYNSRIYRARSNRWFSVSKGHEVYIADMNDYHLKNAISAIEDNASGELLYVQTRYPDVYNKLKGYSITTLASVLCPQYMDLLNEQNKRNTTKATLDTKLSKISTEQVRQAIIVALDNVTKSITKVKPLQNVVKVQPSVPVNVTTKPVEVPKVLVSALLDKLNSQFVRTSVTKFLSGFDITPDSSVSELTGISVSDMVTKSNLTPGVILEFLTLINEQDIQFAYNPSIVLFNLFEYDRANRAFYGDKRKETLEDRYYEFTDSFDSSGSTSTVEDVRYIRDRINDLREINKADRKNKNGLRAVFCNKFLKTAVEATIHNIKL
jgi:hypothetical protein